MGNCNLSEIEVPTVEYCVREVQHIRELGMGWAWFVNDLRAFLPAWQDMELASPFPEKPVSQVDADVPLEPIPLHADAADMELDLHSMRDHSLLHLLEQWNMYQTGTTPMPYLCGRDLSL